MLIYFEKLGVRILLLSKVRTWKADFSVQVHAVTVAVSTAIRELYWCSQQCGQKYLCCLSLSKLSPDIRMFLMTLSAVLQNSFYFILELSVLFLF
jgi:hypothetical protein